MSPFARPDLFWPTEKVAARLGDPKVRVVDCRFTFERDSRADYLKAHLPGAVHLDWSRDIAAPPPASGHPQYMLSGAADFAAAMARVGIGDDTFVIGYDAEGGHHAARLWLALRRYGHDGMAVMEGGIQKWIAEGRPVEAGEVTVQPATFTPRPREGVVATKEQMYIDAGFGPETSTITYCQAGVRAAFTHLVLTVLGHDDVRTYDGSWEEWGNRDDVPIHSGRS